MTAHPTPTYPATPAGLTAALTALGATAEQVADTLTRAGHTGRRGDESCCPIVAYLRAAIPHTIDVYAGLTPPDDSQQWAGIRLDDTDDATGWVDVVMPAGPARFVIAFDDGRFDELAHDQDDANAKA